MPDLSQQILDLQTVDQQISRLSAQLKQIDSQLGDQLKVRAGEHAIRQAEQALQSRQRSQREVEMELSTVEERVQEHNRQLYSGKGSPRELQALQRNIEEDQKRKEHLEEQALAAMSATEAAANEVDRIRAAVARVLGELSTDQQRLAAERQRLQTQLQSRQAQRTQVAADIDAASLALYDRLRQRMSDGVAAAEVVQGRCEGCRTSLPSSEVQRARRSPTLSQCSACGRIIHVPLS